VRIFASPPEVSIRILEDLADAPRFYPEVSSPQESVSAVIEAEFMQDNYAGSRPRHRRQPPPRLAAQADLFKYGS
jgi:hypothetical protein